MSLSPKLHSLNRDVFYVAEPLSSVLFLFGLQMLPGKST
jgi:hypothetical protein